MFRDERLVKTGASPCALSDKAKMTAASDISAKLISFCAPLYKTTSSQAVLPSRPVSILMG